MTESAADLCRFAIECMGCAENAMERVTRDAWLEMAQEWQRLAKQAEEQWQPSLRATGTAPHGRA
jgi:hypothetical protein